MNHLLPVYLKLENKKCAIIGGGQVAFRKTEQLLDCKGQITVISPQFCPQFSSINHSNLQMITDKYSRQYLAGKHLVFICTDDPHLNQQIYSDCNELAILANVIDTPGLCDFYSASVMTRGDLKIAVSTNNQSSAFCKRVRLQLEELFDDSYAKILIYLGKIRRHLICTEPDLQERKKIITQISLADELKKIVDDIDQNDLEKLDVNEELMKWRSIY